MRSTSPLEDLQRRDFIRNAQKALINRANRANSSGGGLAGGAVRSQTQPSYVTESSSSSGGGHTPLFYARRMNDIINPKKKKKPKGASGMSPPGMSNSRMDADMWEGYNMGKSEDSYF